MSASPFIVGEDGPAVVLPGRVARRLAPVLLDALRRARVEGQTIDDEVADGVAAIDRAGRAYAAARVKAGARSDIGTSQVPTTQACATVTEMTTKAAAKCLDRSQRAVVALLARRRLRGRMVGRTWLVDAVSVEEYLEGRAG